MSKAIYTKRQRRLSDLLKAARKEAGLTQIQTARRLGAYKSFVSRYERGQRRLDVIEFLDVAEAIGVDAVQLLRKLKP